MQSGGSNTVSPVNPSSRPSSYSSIVSSVARTTPLDQLPAAVSAAAKPHVTSVTSSGLDVGHRSSGVGSSTGMSTAFIGQLLQATVTV